MKKAVRIEGRVVVVKSFHNGQYSFVNLIPVKEINWNTVSHGDSSVFAATVSVETIKPTVYDSQEVYEEVIAGIVQELTNIKALIAAATPTEQDLNDLGNRYSSCHLSLCSNKQMVFRVKNADQMFEILRGNERLTKIKECWSDCRNLALLQVDNTIAAYQKQRIIAHTPYVVRFGVRSKKNTTARIEPAYNTTGALNHKCCVCDVYINTFGHIKFDGNCICMFCLARLGEQAQQQVKNVPTQITDVYNKNRMLQVL